ncbi:MAG: NifU family protein [Weeksellaceae bacterium]|nr:NifU family protein [Weeksellaceae bacterium]
MNHTNQIHEALVTKVMEALDSIRPFLQKDGGDIELVDVQEKKVFVKLLGSCSSCGISSSTMKLGIESTIKQRAPEIEEVVSV